MDMIERVARAMFDVCSVDGVTLPWEKVDQGKRDLHMEWATAAIEAMREPTEAMVEAGEKYIRAGRLAEEKYKAMINAALKEHEGANADGR